MDFKRILCFAEYIIVLVLRGVGMKKQTRVLKLECITILLAIMVALPVMINDEAKAEDIERIPFALETLKASKMPPVFFSHEKHQEALEDLDDNCVLCHIDGSEYFLESENKSATDVVAYVHKECVSCHIKMAKGPALASCRSCHNDAIAAAQAADAE